MAKHSIFSGSRVVARAKSSVAAHRATRVKKYAGSRVVTLNRAKHVFPPGARVLIDGRDEAIVKQGWPEGSTSYMFPHYTLSIVGGDKNVAVHMSRVGVERRNRTDSLNMAKLSARGRTELARVSIEKETPDSALVSWEKTTVTLMSDGSIMEKRDVKFRSDNRRHSYGWSVLGKAKAGLTPRQFADIYAKRGFEVENVSSFSGDVVVRTEKAVEKSKKARTKRAEKVEIARREEAARSGPGFYVTNSTTGSMRAAELGPFATLDEATSAAWDRLRQFLDMKFTYLLPVQVVETVSREAAEMGDGHVWWTNGKMRGAPVPEGQLAFAV